MLSKYHSNYSQKSDEELASRFASKDHELQEIFSQIKLNTDSNPVRIAVIGCADVRYLPEHIKMFSKHLQKPVEITTFDISIEHLAGGERVIEHDCTLPLPNPPYDITYAHVILKFIETEKQWDLLLNSYNALKAGGLALHFLPENMTMLDGMHEVPIDRWLTQLQAENINYKILNVKTGPNLTADSQVLVLIKS